MNIVLWIGNEANQKALANKINQHHNLIGIVTESRKSKRKMTFKFFIEKVFEKIFLPEISKAWWGMKDYYEKNFPTFPEAPIIDVENINSNDSYYFTQKLKPDVILVSGTRLIKEKLLSLNPTIGILNLHTGMSPYIKGGPNCTNWCIATKQFHLIGNTIMWIDLGIDSGNIYASEFTDLEGNETLSEIHLKVMEHAHNLYLKVLGHLSAGKKSTIKQSEIATGKTYYNKQWTLKNKIRLMQNLKNLRESIKKGEIKKLQKNTLTVSLNRTEND